MSGASEGQGSCSLPDVAAELGTETSALEKAAFRSDTTCTFDDDCATVFTIPGRVPKPKSDTQLSTNCFGHDSLSDLSSMPDSSCLPLSPLLPAKMLLTDILEESSCSFSEVLFPSTPAPDAELLCKKISSVER